MESNSNTEGSIAASRRRVLGSYWSRYDDDIEPVPIICLDGDGSNIMHMGQMAITPGLKSKLVHVVLNNGKHESVGGQPTRGYDINFQAIARGCGYQCVLHATTAEEIKAAIQKAQTETYGSAFVEIKIRCETRADLGRPKTKPVENKTRFMRDFEKN